MSGNRQVGDTEHIRHNKQNEEGETVTQHKQILITSFGIFKLFYRVSLYMYVWLNINIVSIADAR
jgi:hypothetical protein